MIQEKIQMRKLKELRKRQIKKIWTTWKLKKNKILDVEILMKFL